MGKIFTEADFYKYVEEHGEVTSFTIPDGVTEIDEQAFYYCTFLKEVVIPDGVTKVGERDYWKDNGVFYGCESLETVMYKNHNIKQFMIQDEKDYDFNNFEITKVLMDNNILDMNVFCKAVEAKKEDRLRGFIVKTKKKNEKRLSEREIPDIDYSNSDDFNKEF